MVGIDKMNDGLDEYRQMPEDSGPPSVLLKGAWFFSYFLIYLLLVKRTTGGGDVDRRLGNTQNEILKIRAPSRSWDVATAHPFRVMTGHLKIKSVAHRANTTQLRQGQKQPTSARAHRCGWHAVHAEVRMHLRRSARLYVNPCSWLLAAECRRVPGSWIVHKLFAGEPRSGVRPELPPLLSSVVSIYVPSKVYSSAVVVQIFPRLFVTKVVWFERRTKTEKYQVAESVAIEKSSTEKRKPIFFASHT